MLPLVAQGPGDVLPVLRGWCHLPPLPVRWGVPPRSGVPGATASAGWPRRCVLRAAARGLGVDVRLSVVPLDLVFDGQRLQAGAAALS